MTHSASRRRWLLAGGGALLTVAPARAGIPIPLPFGGRKPPAVDPADVARQTGAPAVGGAVVAPKGTLYLEAGGLRRADRPATVTRDDLWHIGSNTKALTAALYGRHVEAGRATWAARLPALFPDLKLHPDWADTRIEDVMAHRAGIADEDVVEAEFLAAAAASLKPVALQRTELVRQVLARPPARPPGSFTYANLNYVVAGAVVERIAQRPWEESLRAELFAPLGMARAGFGPPQGAQPWGHRIGDDKRLHPVAPTEIADFPAVLAPAGGVHLSLADYARFVRVFLTDGGGWLKPETLTRLGRPWGGQDGDYGLGWRATAGEGWAQGPLLQSDGSNTLWHAQVQLAPARGIAVIACANAETGGGVEAARRLGQRLVKAYAA